MLEKKAILANVRVGIERVLRGGRLDFIKLIQLFAVTPMTPSSIILVQCST